MEENETKKERDGNISVPKPLFALLVLVLCGSLCYSAYNAGYMKGVEKNGIAREIPNAPAPEASNENPPANPFEGDKGSAQNGDDWNIFRDNNPFIPREGGNENAPKNDPPKEEENRTQGAFLDIVAATVSDEAKESYNLPSGVIISKVSKNGAAEKAGIKEHSVITAVDGKTVSTIEELKGILSEKYPNDVVQVTLYEPTENHGYEQKTISVTLSDGTAVSRDN